MLTRNESAAMRSASAALRRDVDALNVRMKEDIANLKHECVSYPLLSRPAMLIRDIEFKWRSRTERTSPKTR